MIQSLFIITPSNEICLEKHWTKVTPSVVCDTLFEAIAKARSPQSVPPCIETPHVSLIQIFRCNLFFAAVCLNEVPPLLVIEFLQNVSFIINDYFGVLSESVVKDNTVCIFEILDEMLDGGFPLTTEPNVLKEIVRPPNLLKTITDAVTGKSSQVSTYLPTCQLSNVRWRSECVKYSNNEAYFDLIEELSVIIDRSGNLIHQNTHGSVECLMKLSGMPDLTLTFSNPRIIEDATLHPCVRFMRWRKDRVLSFVPPDGHFTLFSYQANKLSPISIPVQIQHSIIFRKHGSRMELTVVTKTGDKPMNSVKLSIQMPRGVVGLVAAPSIGRASFDATTRVFEWDVGRIETKHASPTLKANMTLASDLTQLPENPPIIVNFSVSQLVASGLKIARVDMYAEKFKFFKGVKYVTRSRQFEVRT